MNKLFKHKLLLANCTLVLVFLFGATYLAIDVMRYNPLQRHYEVTVKLDRSGGLQEGNDVTMRGYRIGQVSSIKIIDSGGSIAAVAKIDRRFQVPQDTLVTVQALSAAGEQFVDFKPNTDSAPFLKNGAVIDYNDGKVRTPTPVWEVLDDTTLLVSQVDPKQFKVILDQLDIALSAGPDQLRALVEGTSIAVAGLHNLLPQTVNLIKNLQVIMETTSHAQPDLQTLTRNSGSLLDQFNKADGELQQVLQVAPQQFQALGAVLDENRDPITSIATNMTAITRAATLRAPALRLLFPSLGHGIGAFGIPAYDGEFHAMIDIWPRPVCKYDTKPEPFWQVQDGTFPKWNYCTNPPPGQQIRGAANAPRPNVPDNGSFMPPGVDPNERTLKPVN
ncbi:MlaD family protein [Nocardia sp. NPDC058658]|uniref:MlaD family protein n=1 Tax=Nocardia sp. NPDC058658 TaxID=3346580 RepID=UPI003657C7B2